MLVRLFKTFGCLCLCLYLTACGRDDDLVIPEETVVGSESYCLDEFPYQVPNFIDSIALSGVDYQFHYTSFDYRLDVNHLNDVAELTIDKVKQPFRPNLRDSLTSGSESGQSLLTEAQINRLQTGDIEVLDNSVSVTYTLLGEEKAFRIPNSQEVGSVSIPLNPGINEVVVTVDAYIDIPFSGIECSLDVYTREVMSFYDSGVSNADTAKALKYIETLNNNFIFTVTYVYQIQRDEVQDIQTTVVNRPEDLYSLGALEDSELSVSNDFIVVGIPTESSSSRGMFTSLQYQNDTGGSIVNDLAGDSGAVYIYEKNSKGQWEFAWMLKANNSSAGDRFGHSVSIEGPWLAVSAPGEDSNSEGVYSRYDIDEEFSARGAQSLVNAGSNDLALDSGAVYLYKLQDDGSWDLHSFIKPENNVRGSSGYAKGFGEQVVVKYALNNTGLNYNHTIAVTSPGEGSLDGTSEDSDAPDSGAVYIYKDDSNVSTKFRYTGVLKSPQPIEGDRFGSSVAIAADGYVYVGAPFESSDDRTIINRSDLEGYSSNKKRLNSGAVYAFFPSVESLSSYELGAIIKSSNSDDSDLFGQNLTAYDNRVAVSAPKEDGASVGLNRDMQSNGSQDSGAVYVFKRNTNNGTFTQELYVKAPENIALSGFGNDLALAKNKLAVAHRKFIKQGVAGSGSMYLYSRDFETEEWSRILTSQEEGVDQYAGSVDIYGESIILTGDNVSPLIILQ